MSSPRPLVGKKPLLALFAVAFLSLFLFVNTSRGLLDVHNYVMASHHQSLSNITKGSFWLSTMNESNATSASPTNASLFVPGEKDQQMLSHIIWNVPFSEQNPYKRYKQCDSATSEGEVQKCKRKCKSKYNPDDGYGVRRQQWNETHWNMTRRALVYNARKDLDLVLLGDSITEQWYGTMLGKPKVKHHYNSIPKLYETLFTKQGGGSLEGLALATAYDETIHLIWHLQNGWLPRQLQPKVWWVLIGTNDIGGACSVEGVLSGLFAIRVLLKRHSPQSHIVFCGLFPRGDVSGEDKLRLGHNWELITKVNRRLETSIRAENSSYLHFFDVRHMFHSNSSQLNRTMMPDGIHPSSIGLKAYGLAILEKVHSILVTQDMEI